MRLVRFLPLVMFALVMGAHAVYASRTVQVSEKVICVLDEQGNCVEDKVVRTTSTVLSREGFSRYLHQQDYFLSFAYALAFAFAVYALMHWHHSRKRAMAGAAFGVGLGSALWAGTCFLVGCCGSPMLSVWLGLFGAKALGLTKPLVAFVTALSVGCGYLRIVLRVTGLILALLVFRAVAFGDSLTISGGLDVRAEAGRSGAEASLDLFLNLRRVISERGTDRWILVFQTDGDDNFKEPHLYQTYVQLKGPLGRWNVRVGRYIVPFGLLGTGHDTERLVLRTIEPLSIGLKLDEGVQVHGFTKRFDYALSLTDGAKENNPVFIGRIGKEKGETIYGWSLLVGRLPETASKESVELPGKVLEGVLIVRKVRLGFDYTRSSGPDLWRAELIAGTDNGRMVGGGYVELDKALNPQWSLNFNAGYWKGSEARWRLGVGATLSLGGGRFVRAALIHQTEKEVRGNALVVQYYYEFARQR